LAAVYCGVVEWLGMAKCSSLADEFGGVWAAWAVSAPSTGSYAGAASQRGYGFKLAVLKMNKPLGSGL